MRASGASELRKFSHFHMLKLLFPSIFCWYFRYFVSEKFSLYHLYDTIYKRQYTNKALTLRKCICAIERSERAQKIFAFSHSKTVISFNILLVLQILCLRNIFYFILFRTTVRDHAGAKSCQVRGFLSNIPHYLFKHLVIEILK